MAALKRLHIPCDCEKRRAARIAPVANLNPCRTFLSLRRMERPSNHGSAPDET
jgi:hypothetical protein